MVNVDLPYRMAYVARIVITTLPDNKVLTRDPRDERF